MSRHDAIVVGGGLSGVAAAVAVARAGLSVLHVAPKAPPDRRTSALMMPSIDYLRDAELLADPSSIGHPLVRIRIIDATNRLLRAPEALFDARESGHDAFGWNLPNTALMAAFEAARTALPGLETREALLRGIEASGDCWRLTLDDGTVAEAPLVVGADGKKSFIRAAGGFRTHEHDFTQAAIVADLELGRSLDGTSVEFHYPQGPFTLVPAGGNRANLVWIDDAEALRRTQAAGRDDLTAAVNAKAQRLFGRITLTTPAFVFPLSSISLDRAGANGIVLVGESAHAFPPIGAQGLNLGLRDVADLADVLAGIDRSPADWARSASETYATRREADLRRTGGMVDSLFRSLLSDFLPAQALRAGGLWALKLMPPLRRKAFEVGMGVR